MPKTRVLIYGNSLWLASVRTLLERLPDIELTAWTASQNITELSALADVVLYDATTDHVPDVFGVLRNHPAIRLIGLDALTQNAIVTQEQTHRLSQTSDLTQLIADCQATPTRPAGDFGTRI